MEVSAQQRLEEKAALVNYLAKDFFMLIKLSCHSWILLAQAGKKESDLAPGFSIYTSHQAAFIVLFKYLDRFCQILADKRAAMSESLASHLSSISQICQDILLRLASAIQAFEIGSQAYCRLVEHLFGSS